MIAMEPDRAVLDQVLCDHFNVSVGEIIKAPSFARRQSEAAPYLTALLNRTLEDIARGDSFVAGLFHVLLGYAVTAGTPPQDARGRLCDYVLSLRLDGAGFFPVPTAAPSASQFARERPLQPEIYATDYSLGTLTLLECSLSEVAEIGGWLGNQVAPSGWIYQRNMGNTVEARKLQNELTRQTLAALRVLELMGGLDRNALASTRDTLDAALPNLLYMGPVCQVVEGLTRLGEPSSTSKQIALAFLARHFDVETGGFLEYLLTEAKVDEVAGHTQRYQHDQLGPSISASYHALCLLRLLAGEPTSRNWWSSNREQVRAFFEGLTPNDDGGFGSPVLVARYPAPFGPVSTPLETVMMVCAPGLLDSLDSLLL